LNIFGGSGNNGRRGYSITVQILLVFIGVIVIAMALCMAANSFLLPRLYSKNTQEAMQQYYEETAELVENADTTQLESEMARMRYTDNISCILVTSTDWTFSPYIANAVSNSERDEMLIRLRSNFSESSDSQDRTIPKHTEVLYSCDSYRIQTTSYMAASTKYMECYGTIGDSNYLFMSTPLASVTEAAAISNRLLLVSMLTAIGIGCILMLIVTRQITKPIGQLAVLSEKLANMDFTERYTGNQMNEIGVLGRSMNRMAEQLRQNISKLQQANAQLQKDIDEKIQIDEVRKEFLSNVSHELKTPIALIQGYAEGLQDSIEDADSRDYYCEVIIDEAQKMNEMVKKLLTLNHLEFGQDKIKFEVFSLSEMLDSTISQNELPASKAGITIVKQYPQDIYVSADEFKMEEVCTNYLSNAVHYAAGEKKITVRMDLTAKQVKVTVENTGSHIPDDSLDKVWIKFYKVDKARTRQYGGSGIGLSIVKAIMDAHHQPYGVYNTPDGVAFWFCLERVPVPLDDTGETDTPRIGQKTREPQKPDSEPAAEQPQRAEDSAGGGDSELSAKPDTADGQPA
jgi:two-component system sensor histidine kinase VanS